MRAVVQRVNTASVTVEGLVIARIDRGFLILLGAESPDGDEDVAWLTGKIARLRVFEDGEGKMNLDLAAVGGDCLVVSQFTLFASTRKGNRPAFVRAAPPEQARTLCDAFVRRLEQDLGRPVPTGRFGAHMRVELVNDGPVTILIDSRNRE